MKEFIEKLIGRLEELKTFKLALADAMSELMKKDKLDNYISKEEVVEIVNQLAEEYDNDFCVWEYDEFETKWQTDCGVLFALHDSDREITQYCPYCGKEIKVAPYQPKGE